MKKTMIFTADGDTYLSVVYKPGEVTHRNVRLDSTLYYAEITGNEQNGFAVRFHLPYFMKYNKGGFISKQSALNYEQDICDAHFDDFIASEPEEIYESVIA